MSDDSEAGRRGENPVPVFRFESQLLSVQWIPPWSFDRRTAMAPEASVSSHRARQEYPLGLESRSMIRSLIGEHRSLMRQPSSRYAASIKSGSSFLGEFTRLLTLRTSNGPA